MEYEVKKLLSPNLYSDILSITEGSTDFSRFNGKTVLITGAGELLGIYLATALLINNDINSADTKVNAVDAGEDIFRRYGKLTNRNDIDFIVSRDYSALLSVSADFVIHTESFVKLDSEAALINLLAFIKQSSARALINTYSGVYGDVFNGKDVIFEDDMGYVNPADPSSRYIQAQRMAESLALRLYRTDGIDISLSRSSLIYGATEFGGESRHIQIITEALRGRTIVIDSDDSTPQSYIYITDAAEALLTVLLDGKQAEIYNIASGYIGAPSLFAHHCVKLFSDKELTVEAKGSPKVISPISPTIKVLDNSKLCALGFTPKVSVSNGIVRSAKILSEVM